MQSRHVFITSLLIALIAGIGQITNTIYVPAMTTMAHDLLVQPHFIQFIIPAYILPYGISMFIYGPLSDHWGRKPVICLGIGIYCLGCLIALAEHHMTGLITGIAIQGCGIGVGGVMCRSVMRDLVSGQALRRANSLMSMLLILSPLLAPLLGGCISYHLGWHAIFIVLLILALIIGLLQLCCFKETLAMRPMIQQPPTQQYRVLFQEKHFRYYAALLLLAFSGVAVFEACASLLFSHVLHFSARTTSLLFITPLPFYLMGSHVFSRLSERVSINQTCCFAIVMILIAGISLLLFNRFLGTSVYTLLSPICLYFFATGLLFPAATTGALEPFAKMAGTAGAVLGGTQNLGAGLFTCCSGFLPQHSALPLACLLCLLGLTMLGLQKSMQPHIAMEPAEHGI